MKKREGMEELKPSIPSRFFVKEKCIFSIRRRTSCQNYYNTFLFKILIELQKKI